MLKKSSLVLSTVGILSLAQVKAHHIGACDFEVGNCTGYYYTDINAAFVDCYDTNGVPISRKEAFYTETLESQCNSTSLSSFEESLNSTYMPSMNSTNSSVNYCDYYLWGEGYQFTQADSGIGLVLLQDRYNTSIDLSYKNGATPVVVPSTPSLSWNWSELTQLIQALTNSQCAQQSSNSTSSSSNTTVSMPTSSVSVLAGLNLPWSSWSSLANLNLDINSWSKAEWKMWIQNYVTYFNAVQVYVSQAKSVVNTAGSVISGLLSGVKGQVSSDVQSAESILGEGASLIVGNLNVTGQISFTEFWKPDFDFDNVTVGEIIADINTASNVITQVKLWFETFFVNGGISQILGQDTTISVSSSSMTTNFTSGSSDNVIVLNVPDQVEAIIAWITANFQAEVSSILSQYNVTVSTSGVITTGMMNSTNSTNSTNSSTSGNETLGNSTLPIGTGGSSGLNTTNSTNSTSNSSSSDNSTTNSTSNSSSSSNSTTMYNTTYDWSVNYTVPSGCALVNGSNSSVRCSSGVFRGVTFTFEEIDAYWASSTASACSAAQSTYA